jgi:adenylate cyclase
MFTRAINVPWRAATAGLLTVIAVSLFSMTAPMQDLELMASDFAVYHGKLPPPTGRVVVAAVDERSIAELGRWPWSRSVEARLVDALKDYRVAEIGFDMVFSERESEINDRRFASSMAAQNSTYIGYFFTTHQPLKDVDLAIYKTAFLDAPPLAYNVVRKETDAQQPFLLAGGYLPSIPQFNRAAAGTAFLNVDEDIDGEVRSYPAVVRLNGIYCVPLFLALADAFLHSAPLSLTLVDYGVGRVALGDRVIPVDEKGRVMMHFRGPAGTIPRYSISDVVNHRIPPDALARKVVVIGVTALGIGDRFVTPAGRDFPGAEVLATAVDNAVAGDFIYHSLKTSDAEEIAAWILGVAVTLAGAFTSAWFSFGMMIVLVVGYLSYAMWRLDSDSVLIGFVLPCLTAGLTYLVVISLRYVVEGRRGEFLARFVSPQLARSLLERGLTDTMQQKRVQLSVVACDLRGFTAFAESAAPEDVIQFLREYYDIVGRVVTDSGGAILSFAGDGILSLIGAPVTRTDHAQCAIRIALKIIDNFREMTERWERLGLRVGLGVGVASGFVTTGTISSSDHLEYMAVGPAVNLAARLMSHAGSGQILVDHRTVGLVGEHEALCRFESIGSAELKGFARPVELFSARPAEAAESHP